MLFMLRKAASYAIDYVLVMIFTFCAEIFYLDPATANQGDQVKAGDPIVEVDLKKLSEKFDMSTMLVITNDNGKKICFIEPGKVEKGQSICTLA